MRTIICTTGTSIANRCPALAGWQKKASSWDEPAADLEGQIADRIKSFDLATEKGRTEISVEINSLSRLGMEPDDEVVLLATDTADGHVCAEAVAGAIGRAFKLDEGRVVIHRIAGLQVRDADRLRDEGLVHLVDKVLEYVMDPQVRYRGEIILNPTGGFKGIVPYLTALGMLYHLRTVYVFEFSQALIALPPLPVSFDLALYERALPALSAIYRESAVKEEQYYKLITGFMEYERDLFSGFVERSGRDVTLSPLCFALYKMEQAGPRRLLLSPNVARALQGMDEHQRLNAERLFFKLANPLWRSMHIHSHSGEFEVYKPGDVAIRPACLTRGDNVYVCILYTSHDEYEHDLSSRRAAEFDLDRFSEWEPLEPVDKHEAHFQHAMEQEIRVLREENEELKKFQAKKQAEANEKTAAAARGKVRGELAKAYSTIGRLNGDIASLQKQIEKYKKLLAKQS